MDFIKVKLNIWVYFYQDTRWALSGMNSWLIACRLPWEAIKRKRNLFSLFLKSA